MQIIGYHVTRVLASYPLIAWRGWSHPVDTYQRPHGRRLIDFNTITRAWSQSGAHVRHMRHCCTCKRHTTVARAYATLLLLHMHMHLHVPTRWLRSGNSEMTTLITELYTSHGTCWPTQFISLTVCWRWEIYFRQFLFVVWSLLV